MGPFKSTSDKLSRYTTRWRDDTVEIGSEQLPEADLRSVYTLLQQVWSLSFGIIGQHLADGGFK